MQLTINKKKWKISNNNSAFPFVIHLQNRFAFYKYTELTEFTQLYSVRIISEGFGIILAKNTVLHIVR